jgi:hypothetical protein
MRRCLIIGGLLALAPGHAFAASGNSTTVSGTTSATVVGPISLKHTPGAILNFGTMTVGAGGGDVIVTTAGNGVAIGAVALVPSAGSSADQFSVTGDPNRNFSVTTGSGYVTAGSSSMLFATTPSATQTTLGATGTGTFSVGGSLLIGSGIPPGVYTGTYTVTVAYD